MHKECVLNEISLMKVAYLTISNTLFCTLRSRTSTVKGHGWDVAPGGNQGDADDSCGKSYNGVGA